MQHKDWFDERRSKEGGKERRKEGEVVGEREREREPCVRFVAHLKARPHENSLLRLFSLHNIGSYTVRAEILLILCSA